MKTLLNNYVKEKLKTLDFNRIFEIPDHQNDFMKCLGIRFPGIEILEGEGVFRLIGRFGEIDHGPTNSTEACTRYLEY